MIRPETWHALNGVALHEKHYPEVRHDTFTSPGSLDVASGPARPVELSHINPLPPLTAEGAAKFFRAQAMRQGVTWDGHDPDNWIDSVVADRVRETIAALNIFLGRQSEETFRGALYALQSYGRLMKWR